MPNIIDNGFNKDLSAFARITKNKSNEEIFNRYFIKGSKEDFKKDIFTELDTNSDNYPLLCSLVGDNLSYILSKLKRTMNPYIPTGYKINTKSLATDVEALLTENKAQVGRAVAQRKPNQYIVEVCGHMIEIMLRGLGYTNNAEV